MCIPHYRSRFILKNISLGNSEVTWSLLLLLSHFSCVQLCATPWMAPTRLPRPRDSPGKNTGVGCHFLLQCLKVKSENEVAQSCPTLSDPMDCSLPGFSIYGILQARVLEWGAIAFSKLGLQRLKKSPKQEILEDKHPANTLRSTYCTKPSFMLNNPSFQ